MRGAFKLASMSKTPALALMAGDYEHIQETERHPSLPPKGK
eukprot:CAMPEP_0115556604 /NCGR_PEP_ID=MMETSP0271-20121206/98458_1 /TAXON_ID=71861 /ORGANISM="Scrippsiella trochoidea, Strain CCMP3099" /LENGTH=40 /DNA_ID= /DNA_START= /DNA_END= /DNA_ORIENTATION=